MPTQSTQLPPCSRSTRYGQGGRNAKFFQPAASLASTLSLSPRWAGGSSPAVSRWTNFPKTTSAAYSRAFKRKTTTAMRRFSANWMGSQRASALRGRSLPSHGSFTKEATSSPSPGLAGKSIWKKITRHSPCNGPPLRCKRWTASSQPIRCPPIATRRFPPSRLSSYPGSAVIVDVNTASLCIIGVRRVQIPSELQRPPSQPATQCSPATQ